MGGRMIIRAVQLRIHTSKGLYGFSFSFSRRLTVIRGNNSSGKSTFFNCLLYSLGMEELLGGKGAHNLPYAVRDYFDEGTQKITILSSEMMTEIENRDGQIVTLRRPIQDQTKDSRLVEIVRAPVLSEGLQFEHPTPTYLHDPGSAQKKEGFYHFLEEFLGLDLPQVSSTKGSEVKLYLQAIFAAHAVEQKRGWTDYIASIPFYGIRDARTRVAEYILGLGVFETISKRTKLDAEAVLIDQDWRNIVGELRRESAALGFVMEQVPAKPSTAYRQEHTILTRTTDTGDLTLPQYISKLLDDHTATVKKLESTVTPDNSALLKDLEAAEEEALSLNVLHERATSNLSLQRASLKEYEELLRDAKADLDRNKVAQKLQRLGAEQALELALGSCPTCHQPVEDTLLGESLSGPHMDLQTNIDYLESQARMLQRQINGLKENISKSLTTLAGLSSSLLSKRDYSTTLRSNLGSSELQTKVFLRRQVQIELEVERLQKLDLAAAKHSLALEEVAKRLTENQLARKELPKEQYSVEDEAKISLFEKHFRANAGSFGYESVANLSEIKIDRESLIPGLEQIELRQIRKTDIKADSSASDFVRLIWSYLLGLYQTSANPHAPGNHIGIILFDEPGQHSMRWESQRELLLRLAAEPQLQSIVAASFDESESVFRDVTGDVHHKLIKWEGKLIQPMKS
ncbi:AAA family ATPase [Metapseudomonas otitidis]|uniref:AAA family ATPase n=1 Tax=Metapseudomonas otitidis TaxID=319939 RepID=UPI003133187B